MEQFNAFLISLTRAFQNGVPGNLGWYINILHCGKCRTSKLSDKNFGSDKFCLKYANKHAYPIQVNFKEYVNKQKNNTIYKKNLPKNYMIQHMKHCIILSYKELILAFAGYHLVLLIVSRVLFDFLETAWLFKCSVFF